MKEFIEKLIGKLEGVKSEVNTPADNVWNNAVKVCIDNANELAEEYKLLENIEQLNNGWIPCTERLPEEATTYEVTEEVIVNSKKQYIVVHRLFGTEGQWILPPNRKVIAWMPLPSPYKED